MAGRRIPAFAASIVAEWPQVAAPLGDEAFSCKHGYDAAFGPYGTPHRHRDESYDGIRERRALLHSLNHAHRVQRLSPLFRYPGGKRNEIKHYAHLLPSPDWPCGLYVEPFVGGGATFFHLNHPGPSVIADLNPQVINFYRQVQAGGSLALASMLASTLNTERTYLYVRDWLDTRDDPLLEAFRFYYLRQTCFRGIDQFDRRGRFNTKWNSSSSRQVPAWRRLLNPAYESLLRRTRVLLQSFEETMAEYSPDDEAFIFLDPPYLDVDHYPAAGLICTPSDACGGRMSGVAEEEEEEFSGESIDNGLADSMVEAANYIDHGSGRYGNDDPKEQVGFGRREHERLRDLIAESRARCLLIVADSPCMRQLYRGFVVGSYDKTYAMKRNQRVARTRHLIISNYTLGEGA